MPNSVFLHFTDRELLKSTNINSTHENLLIDVLLCSLFMSKDIYISLAHFFEIGDMFPNLKIYLKNLYKYNEIKNILSARNEEEFLLKRQQIYFYDKDRYPFYFDDKILNNFPDFHIAFEQSTSDYIEKELKLIVESKSQKYGFLDDEIMFELLWKRLELDVDNAYTIKSFAGIFKEDPNLSQKGSLYSTIVSNKVEMLMSVLHNTNYIQKTASNIIINIPLINKYDILDSYSKFDFRLYRTILDPLFKPLKHKSIEETVYSIIKLRNNNYFIEFIDDLYDFIYNLIYSYQLIFPDAVYDIIINKIIYDIVKIKKIIDTDRICLEIEQVYSYLHKLKKCQNQSIGFDIYSSVNKNISQLPYNKANKISINIREINMRDTYYAENAGIQGAKAGKNAQVTLNFNENANNEFNYEAIIDEIVLIKNYLKSQEENDENYILMGELAKLNQATIKKEDNKIIEILKKCGKQIIDISKNVGCSILATYITNKLGI